MDNLFEILIYKEEEVDGISNAFKEASLLWKWGMEEKYKNIPKDSLEKQLKIFADNMNNKFLQLVNCERKYIPGDAFVDLAYKPTYVAASVYVFAYNSYPELFQKEEYLLAMQSLLQSSLGRDMLDHGYEAEDGRLQNMLMFAKSGVKKFIVKHPEECNEFALFTKYLYEKLDKDVDKCHANGKPYKVNGFGDVLADEDAMDVLTAYYGKRQEV